MKIYLVRHGESAPALSDDERPLTEKGKEDISKLAAFLKSQHIQVSEIAHSKKLRAQKTAEILSSALVFDGKLHTRDELDPLHSIDMLIDEIAALNKDIMFVGHMPFMGRLVAKLAAGNEDIDIANFKPGCIVCLEQIGTQRWTMNWMLSPELFI